MKNKIQAILFDMDNLMIDSEDLHFQAYQKVLAGFDISFTPDDYARYHGRADRDVCKDLAYHYPEKFSPESLLEKKNQIFRTEFITKVVVKDGLRELLEKLTRDRYLMAVASGSQAQEIEHILAHANLRKYFSTIVSVDFVKHGKPAPDIFLLAAERLHTAPQHCLVIEDALSGLEAAKKAGMYCFVIPSSRKPEEFAGATQILSNLSNVYDALQTLQSM